jgi:D-3-phosphoglycerate dehydrogenase
VNVPSVTGELLTKLRPFLYLAGKMGLMQSQLVKGPFKEIAIEYAGNFFDLDLRPVTLAALRGILTPLVSYEVNSVNAASLAKNMGIKVTETTSQATENYINLIRMTVTTENGTDLVAGTIFGKEDPRIIRINKFRLEVIPEGHLALIHNIDKPGSIGNIGRCLGEHDINIARMTVGREDDGDRNIIFLQTDTPISSEIAEEVSGLGLVNSMVTFEL